MPPPPLADSPYGAAYACYLPPMPAFDRSPELWAVARNSPDCLPLLRQICRARGFAGKRSDADSQERTDLAAGSEEVRALRIVQGLLLTRIRRSAEIDSVVGPSSKSLMSVNICRVLGSLPCAVTASAF